MVGRTIAPLSDGKLQKTAYMRREGRPRGVRQRDKQTGGEEEKLTIRRANFVGLY